MTDYSVNGWIVLHDYPPPAGEFTAPGGKAVYCNSREVAVVFEWFARWWHANITPIAASHPANRSRPRERKGTTPDGKWDAVGIHSWRKGTKIAGTNLYSNHCSATGMDINGHLHPYEYTAPKPFRDGLTSGQKAAIRAKCKEARVLRHGIDFSPGRTDPMHVEIGPGVSRVSVQQAAKRLEDEIGRSSTGPVWWKGAYGHDVAAVQGQLNRAGFNAGTEDGSAGAKTDTAVRALQKAAGITVDGRVGPGTREALALAEIGEGLEPITEEAELMAAKDDIIAAFTAELAKRDGQLGTIEWAARTAANNALYHGPNKVFDRLAPVVRGAANMDTAAVGSAIADALLPEVIAAIGEAGSGGTAEEIVNLISERLANGADDTPQEDQ